jgi:hypothetical protein
MDRTYDVFERLPDGTSLWGASVVVQDEAICNLTELAATGPDEFRLLHLATNTLGVAINVPHEPTS